VRAVGIAIAVEDFGASLMRLSATPSTLRRNWFGAIAERNLPKQVGLTARVTSCPCAFAGADASLRGEGAR
jgi:hypothetical protein